MRKRILYKYVILVFLSLLFTIKMVGQEKRLEKANENFNRFAFVDARKIYLDVAKSGYESSDLLKKLADSYYFNAELENAAPWYEKLVSNYENEIEAEYLFRYSQSLKSVERYEEADRIMERFNMLSENDNRAEFFINTRDYLKFIEMQSGKYEIQPLYVNSKYSDYAPSFNHQGQLIFASSRGGRSGMVKTIHQWNEMPFLDIYSCEMIGERKALTRPSRLKGKINTRLHESSTSFSKDGKTVYFTRNNFTDKKIGANTNGTILLKLYKATLDGEKWLNVEELPFNSDQYSVAHPALSADGKKLYFASDMPGSLGESDLYVVDIFEDGTYGNPKNLGDRINTEGRETFPYLSDSGRLYFASNGHIGLGGLDIFVAIPEEFGMFSIPYNVGRPVNGPEDDFTFVLDESSKIGYFSSNRKGGKGNDDIYRFKQIDELITECNQYVTGTITDNITEETLPNAEVFLMNSNNEELQRTITDDNGMYRFELDCELAYVIRAKKETYSPTETRLVTNYTPNHVYELPLQLGKGGLENEEAKPGDDLAKLLQLLPIYFDFDRATIRSESEIELQKVIAALKQYPELKIEIRSHTDSRANDKYNMYLSEKRAKNTIKYIVKKGGINATRVKGRGYGETKLVNKCANEVPCTEKEHRLNRRSEFIIIE